MRAISVDATALASAAIMRIVGCLLLTGALAALSSMRIEAAPFAYIANHGAASVSVVDVGNSSVAATIPVGTAPFGVALAPGIARAYVSNHSAGRLSVINTDTQTVVVTIPVGLAPMVWR